LVEDIVRGFGYLTLGTRLKRIGERLQADAQKITEGAGADVQSSQYPFLAAVDHLGPLGIGELAEAVGITQPGATRAVNQLVRLGLLEARTSSGDQRRRIVSLTPVGKSFVAEGKVHVWPLIRAAVADLCEGLSGPLLDQLAAIEDGLSEKPLHRRVKKPGKRP